MANSFSGLVLPLLATKSAQYLAANSAILSRCRVETRQQADVSQGGGSINIPLPASRMTPLDYTYPSTPSYTDIQDITIPNVTVNFTIHKRAKVKINDFESRTSSGNLDSILNLQMPAMFDGLAVAIDQALIALYTNLSTTPVGTPGVALTVPTITTAIAALSKSNINPQRGDVHLVLGDQVYWNQYSALAASNTALAFGVGDQRFIQTGDAGNIFGCRVAYSQNIVQTVSSPTTTNNLLFHKDAFVIAFLEYEPVAKYNPTSGVSERIYTDPATGISTRAQMYYDPNLGAHTLAVDVTCGVSVYDANRGVVIQT